MARRQYLILSSSIFSLVATLHLLRAIFAWPVVVASWKVPVWISWPAAVGAGALAAWGFLAARTYDRIIRR